MGHETQRTGQGESPRELPRTPRARREPRLDRVALSVGWLAAITLGLAAWLAVRDPAVEGHAVLARRTGEVADAVVDEWNRWLGDPATPLPGAAAPTITERVDAERAPRPEPLEYWRGARRGGTAYDALLDEAAIRERGADYTEAVGLVSDALRLELDAPRRAEARLRLIQLAGRLGDAALARETLDAALGELQGHELRDGTSYRLLCLLAALPALPDAERARRLDTLIRDWRAERLGWSHPTAEIAFDERGQPALRHHPWRAAMRARLVAALDALPAPARAELDALVGRDPSGLLALDGAAWRERLQSARESALASRGEHGEAPPTGWRLFPVQPPIPGSDGLLLGERSRDGAVQGRILDLQLVPPGALAEAFVERLDAAGVLRGGFVLDLTAGDPELGQALRGDISLARSPLSATIRHPDPDSLVGEVRGRVLALRGGLVVAAVLCAFAGTALSRALRRQQRLARLRSAFVASVSHELRTPVASLLLMAENLADGRVGPERVPRYHALIRREATRLQRLVHDVLDVSRLERGLPPSLRLEPLDLPAFVDGLHGEVRGLVEAEGGRCELHVGELPGEARWDAEALRRAMLNLVDNALRHGRGADGRVELSLDVCCAGAGAGASASARDAEATAGAAADVDATADADADADATAGASVGAAADLRVTIRVADQGRGLGPRPAALFEPFARGGREGEAPGTGLGLAIVRAIAEGHAGGLRAVPSARGACLELSLPVASRGAPAPSRTETLS